MDVIIQDVKLRVNKVISSAGAVRLHKLPDSQNYRVRALVALMEAC